MTATKHAQMIFDAAIAAHSLACRTARIASAAADRLAYALRATPIR